MGAAATEHNAEGTECINVPGLSEELCNGGTNQRSQVCDHTSDAFLAASTKPTSNHSTYVRSSCARLAMTPSQSRIFCGTSLRPDGRPMPPAYAEVAFPVKRHRRVCFHSRGGQIAICSSIPKADQPFSPTQVSRGAGASQKAGGSQVREEERPQAGLFRGASRRMCCWFRGRRAHHWQTAWASWHLTSPEAALSCRDATVAEA